MSAIWGQNRAHLGRHLGDAHPRRRPAARACVQEFSDGEIEDDPILRGIDKNNPVARNPCLRRGPPSLDYRTRLPEQFWRSTRRLLGVN